VIGIDKPVERRLNRLARPLRLAVLTMLAVMLVLHLGPICEAVANAAPVESGRADREGRHKPKKAPQQAACSTPCMAVQSEALAQTGPNAPIRIALKPLPVAGLMGMPVPPATPPPRAV